MARARIAYQLKIASCEEYAALTYALLRDDAWYNANILDVNKISVKYIFSEKIHHAFVLLFYDGIHVVVDPWICNPYAVPLRISRFWPYWFNKNCIVVRDKFVKNSGFTSRKENVRNGTMHNHQIQNSIEMQARKSLRESKYDSKPFPKWLFDAEWISDDKKWHIFQYNPTTLENIELEYEVDYLENHNPAYLWRNYEGFDL